MDAAADRQEATFRTMGDRSQLERALMNVVRNAVKFTPTHGHVTIALATQDSHVEFVCQDSGIGIPEKDMKNLSDRFFRASNAIEQQVPGSGLGLSIVRAIVEGHQGTMKIGSVEGEGTRVAIILPLAGASDGIAPSVLVEEVLHRVDVFRVVHRLLQVLRRVDFFALVLNHPLRPIDHGRGLAAGGPTVSHINPMLDCLLTHTLFGTLLPCARRAIVCRRGQQWVRPRRAGSGVTPGRRAPWARRRSRWRHTRRRWGETCREPVVHARTRGQ